MKKGLREGVESRSEAGDQSRGSPDGPGERSPEWAGSKQSGYWVRGESTGLADAVDGRQGVKRGCFLKWVILKCVYIRGKTDDFCGANTPNSV